MTPANPPPQQYLYTDIDGITRTITLPPRGTPEWEREMAGGVGTAWALGKLTPVRAP